MSRRSGYAPAILAAALACTWFPAGCATEPAFAFRSQRGAQTVPVERLQVDALIASLGPATPMRPAMFEAFKASLVLRFALCRVRAKLLSSPADFEHPDAGITHTLTIRTVDKQVVETRVRNQYSTHDQTYYSGTVYFGVELEDARSQASVWSARSSFKFSTASLDEEDLEILASDFARGIVTQLQRDGLLTGCVHETYPGCVADRLEGLQRAERIPDRLERVDAVNRLHACR
jgi:hypothetical protein